MSKVIVTSKTKDKVRKLKKKLEEYWSTIFPRPYARKMTAEDEEPQKEANKGRCS
jgi:hypothetical protein